MFGAAPKILCDLGFLRDLCANPLLLAESAKGAETAERQC